MGSSRSGLAFERATAQALQELGWGASITSSTGDFGADVVARLGRACTVVQCKDWATPAGFDAVKEVIYARLHYKADFALVVSRSGFTRQATEAARSQGVTLLSLDDLKPGCAFDRIVDAQRLAAGREERRLRIEARDLDRQLKNAVQARELQARQEMEARAKRLRENEQGLAQKAALDKAQWNSYYVSVAKRKELNAKNENIAKWAGVISIPLFIFLSNRFLDQRGDASVWTYIVAVLLGEIFIVLPVFGWLVHDVPPEPRPPQN